MVLAMGMAIDRPAVAPRPGTLLDVATVLEAANEWADADGLWQSANCGDLNLDYAASCVIDPEAERPTKEFDEATWVNGFRFAAYKGLECKLMDLAEMARLNEQAFLDFESASVEAVFGARVLEDATDLTPSGGALTVKEGLAMLEGHAGPHYAGVPTIHASTQIVSLLDSDGAGITLGPDGFRTTVGSKLVNGAGYYGLDDTDATLTEGEAWLFATGEVVLTRSKNLGGDAAQLDMSTNEAAALAERTYLAAFDCYSVKVKVKVFA